MGIEVPSTALDELLGTHHEFLGSEIVLVVPSSCGHRPAAVGESTQGTEGKTAEIWCMHAAPMTPKVKRFVALSAQGALAPSDLAPTRATNDTWSRRQITDQTEVVATNP